jgi:hypothetical protein
MDILNRTLILVVLVALPATSAWAGKRGRPVVVDADGVATTATPAVVAPVDLDTTAVDMLRDADREDLSLRQLATLQREVSRLNMMEGKAESDGVLSQRDASRLYRSGVRSCEKIMMEDSYRQTSTRLGASSSSSGVIFLPSQAAEGEQAPVRGRRHLR